MFAKLFSRGRAGFFGMAISFLLSSCYETKQEFTLNPDGSGKVRHECSFQNVNIGDNDATPEEQLQTAIGRIINDSKGVDAWDEVSFKQLDDGRMWFRGTAYFKKLEDLEITNQSLFSFVWKKAGGDAAELVMHMKKSDAGNRRNKLDDAKPGEAERARKIKEERAKFQQAKPMLTAMLGGLRQDVEFILPGQVLKSTNFKKSATGSLALAFEGGRMIEAMDQLMADDEWIAKNGFDAQNAPEMDAAFAGMLFGEKAPVSASVAVGGGKPLFDYAAEVTAARANADKLQKQLGVVAVAPPARGEDLKFIRVTGVRMAREVDKKLDLRPFHQEPGYSLAVLVGFPGSVLDVTDKSVITKATASDGSSLLKGEREWDRRLGFSKLSADKAAAMFELELKLPGPEVKGIKEISGVIQYRVAGATRETRLGPMPLEAGARSAELDASIKEIKEGWKKNGSQDMELKVKLKPKDLKSAWLLADGEKTELKTGGYSSSGNTTTFTLQSDAKLPEKGEIILEIHDQIRTFEVPFTLENLSLLGNPLGADA